jgi:hypothetical protein
MSELVTGPATASAFQSSVPSLTLMAHRFLLRRNLPVGLQSR